MDSLEKALTHNVERIYPTTDALREVLKTGKKLRLYVGVDPTSPHLHIGHAMQFKKLRDFQDLGHEVILLIGSFTAMIGDPTDKSATRKQLTREEVMQNAATYKEQAAKIIRFDGENPAKLMFNDEWLGTLTFKEVLELTSQFTVQQMMERDMFEKRFYGTFTCKKCGAISSAKGYTGIREDSRRGSDGKTITERIRRHSFRHCPNCGEVVNYPSEDQPIGLHEFMYPLMQGFDSVAMDVDVEIGGNDQTFNMLAGRTLMKAGVLGHKSKEKFVVAVKLLTNEEGKKMSKSEGGFIAIDDSPEDMFGKIMAMGDSMIVPYFTYVLDATQDELSSIKERLTVENPRDVKMLLARRVVEQYHGSEAGERACANFVRIFQEHAVPEHMEDLSVIAGENIVDVLVRAGFATSKSNARQLIEQGGVRLNDETIQDFSFLVDTSKLPAVLQKGKRSFIRLVA